jgi:hypothetical protein|nr:MAG TPA: hypothetical protein [Caudoviricetes sp.]DAU26663.1 MAG TPA: hypothetical protein [Caudoviricetes sp.]DAU77712.1 MAG TPA: hypothetical protein [Caudoviricetes sp.]DAX31954.1 MAG TPA: hypothetical protein [Caudoviricetes sp.]
MNAVPPEDRISAAEYIAKQLAVGKAAKHG